jgi:hypothetical protein
MSGELASSFLMRQADDLETLRSTLSHGRESETSSRPGIRRWGGEVPADLHHPGFVGTRRNSGNLDPARFQLDHEEHVERDERGNFREGASADGLTPHGQSLQTCLLPNGTLVRSQRAGHHSLPINLRVGVLDQWQSGAVRGAPAVEEPSKPRPSGQSFWARFSMNHSPPTGGSPVSDAMVSAPSSDSMHSALEKSDGLDDRNVS